MTHVLYSTDKLVKLNLGSVDEFAIYSYGDLVLLVINGLAYIDDRTQTLTTWNHINSNDLNYPHTVISNEELHRKFTKYFYDKLKREVLK